MSLTEATTTETLPPTGETPHGIFEIIGRFSGRGEPIVDGDVASWLLERGRLVRGDAEFFDELCWRLLGVGVPLWRATMSVRTLHPQILGLSFRWWRNRRLTEVVRIGHGARETTDYLTSPIRIVMEEGRSVRFCLDSTTPVEQFPFLGELRDAGGTDYFATPIRFFNGTNQSATWASDQPGGFSAACFSTLEAIMPALSAVLEARASRRLAGTLLNVYLGRTAGQRILDGVIRRAQGEKLHAVIMASDMRGFTTLSDRLPPDELIALLDDYFDAITAPVEAHGGEVLKFMGDGLLAIFPIDGAAKSAAQAALTAATQGLDRIARINEQRTDTDRAVFRIGIGLHLGEVVFGNVGAVDRLDFTVIGPAVNLAARLEGLTKRLGRSLVVSSDFAATCEASLVSLGFHPVRGISEPEEVFGLPDGGEP